MWHNAQSCSKVTGNGKVILDTHPESDQHQNWTSSRGSPPAPTHQIWWWSMNPFSRYLADKDSAHRHTDRHTDRQTDTRRWPQDLAAYGAQVTTKLMQSHRRQSYSRQVAVSHLAVPSRLQVASQSYFSPVIHISLRDWLRGLGWGMRKWRSEPPDGHNGIGRTFSL